MLTLTPSAAREIQAAAERSGLDDGDWALRIAADVDTGGELRFGMGFDEARQADLAYTDHGVPLLIGSPSQSLLAGVTLDFVQLQAETDPGSTPAQDAAGWGFVFLPPADEPAGGGTGTGCGSSGSSTETEAGGCARCGSRSSRCG